MLWVALCLAQGLVLVVERRHDSEAGPGQVRFGEDGCGGEPVAVELERGGGVARERGRRRGEGRPRWAASRAEYPEDRGPGCRPAVPGAEHCPATANSVTALPGGQFLDALGTPSGANQ